MDLSVNKDFVNCLENMMGGGGIKWSFSIYPELTLLWVLLLGTLKQNLMFKSKTRHLQKLHLNPIMHTTSSNEMHQKYYYKKI